MIGQQFTTNINPETKDTHELTVRHSYYIHKCIKGCFVAPVFENWLSLWFSSMKLLSKTYDAFLLHHVTAHGDNEDHNLYFSN